MANITLLGASYTDVPAVTLPQTGGGTVTFYENGGGGAGVPNLLAQKTITMSDTYTSSNKLQVNLEVSSSCFVLVYIDSMPSPPASGYTAIWELVGVTSYGNFSMGHNILRANGTLGTDGSMLSYNKTTGVASLGGTYGYFRQGDTYHILQFSI